MGFSIISINLFALPSLDSYLWSLFATNRVVYRVIDNTYWNSYLLMGKKIIFLSFLLFSINSWTQSSLTLTPEQVLKKVFDSIGKIYPEIVQSPEKYRLKVVLTGIKRSNEQVQLETAGFRTDANEYLYPASTVKLPSLLVALEESNRLKAMNSSLSSSTSLSFIKKKGCLTSSNSFKINKVSHPITLDLLGKQVLLVSDNNAYNYIFEYCGQKLLNQRITSIGFDNARFTRKFVLNCSLEENRISDSIVFLDANNKAIYSRPMITNTDSIFVDTTATLGQKYIGPDKKIIDKPFDFSKQNNFNVLDLHKVVSGLFFPSSSFSHKFDITKEQRQFLIKNMGAYPYESDLNYSKTDYFPAYKKYIFYGRTPRLDISEDTLNRFRSFNTVGLSFGCVIDAAYLVDYETGKECILTMAVYANKDELINDAKYDYETFAFPLFKDFGKIVMHYLNENKSAVPHLKHTAKELGFLK